MRKFIAIALSLGALTLLLIACSADQAPISPSAADYASDADKKGGPDLFDPPPGFNQYLIELSNRFDSLQWTKEEITINLMLSEEKEVSFPGYEPIIIKFTPDSETVIPLGDPTEVKFFLSVPKAPSSGTLYVPGNCMVFRTENLPDNKFGSLEIQLPVMDFYDYSNYDGIFSSCHLDSNEYGFPDAFDVELITIADWPDDPINPPMYISVTNLEEKDNPSSATDRVLDPGAIGDEL